VSGASDILCLSPNNLNIETFNGLLQKLNAPFKRLNEGYMQIGPGKSNDYSW
jgi:hypothetical protein